MAQVVVNKSDTFEVQRQKINEIGLDLHTFNSSQIILNASYITLTDLSVTVNSAGGAGNLTYDNTTGAIAYTPPDLSNFITSIGDAIQDADFTSAGLMVTDGSGNYSVVTDNSATWVTLQGLQVTNNTPSAGGASLSYNNTTGIFTFTPQDVSTYITLSDISVTSLSASGNGSLTYDGSTGVLSFTPLDINSFNSITVGGNGSTGGVTISDGSVAIRTGTGNVAAIDLYCEVTNAHKVSLKAPAHANFSGDHEFVLPPDEGTNGQVLQTDGNGVTTWVDQTGGSTPTLAAVTAAGNTTTTSITTDGGSFVAQIGTTNQGFYLNSSSNTHLGISWSSSASQYSFRGDSGGNYPLIIDDFSGISILPSSGAASLGYAGSNKLVTTNTGVTVTGALTAGSFVKTGGTSSEFLKADGSVDSSTYLTGINIEDISNVNINSIQTNQILKWDGTEWVNALDSGGSGGGIALGDLTVGTEGTPSGNGGLGYNNLTGQFTFTPAADDTLVFNHANTTTTQILHTNNGAGNVQTLNLIAGTGITFGQGGGTGSLTITGTSGIGLTDLSVGSEGVASGDGAIAYNNATGVFTYTPPDLSGYISSYTETDTLDDVAGRGATTDKNITLTGTASFPGRFDVQNNGNYAISLNATSGVGINTNDGVGLYIGNLATNVWRASISGSTGDITGNKFVKTSGTSSQFLKADGSVDSNTYLTSISLASSNINDLADVNAGTPTDGHVLKWDAGTSKWIAAVDGGGSGGSAAVVAELDQWEMTTGMSSEDDQDGQGNPTIATADGRKILNNIVNDSNTSASVAARSAAPFAKLGNGMSVDSSGLWTFPTTGKWEVTFAAQFQSSGNISGGAGNGYETSTVDIYIETTTDTGSNWSNAAQATDNTLRHFHQGKDKTSQFCKAYIDITDVATDKIRFKVNATANGTIASGKGAIMSFAKADASGGGLQLADLSVTTNAAGTAALAYNTGTGVFSYTPPDLSAVSTDLTAFSVGSNATASGGGGLAYSNSTGVFTYTPPDLSSYLTGVAVNDLTDVSVNSPVLGHVLKYNGASWENAAPAPTLSNIADAGYGVDITGKAALTDGIDIDSGGSINASLCSLDFTSCTINFGSSTISGLQSTINAGVDVHLNKSTATSGQVLSWDGSDYDWVAAAQGIVLSDISVTTNAAGTAALSYDNVTGVFSYTPPNISSFITLGSLSVGSPQTASGDGAISYNSVNGVFSYTPPDLSAHLTTSSVIANLADVVITGSPQSGQVLKWDNGTSKWTNQADSSGGSTLTTEQVQDIVGAMFSGNTETRIAATYQDGDGTIDLVVDDMTANTQPLTTEQVQDIVGGMFSGNTETRIAATYQDADGTIDLVVDDQSGGGGASIIADLTDVVISGSPADDQVLAWDNSSSKWTNQTPGGGIPAGGIIMWSGTVANIPSGWYLCNGSYGTPDLRDRFVVGAGSSYNPGNTGGSETVSISTSNMPSHNHSVSSHSHTIPSHAHTVSSHSHTIGAHTHSFSGSGTGTSGVQSDNHYHSGNTSDAGLHNHSYVTHSSLFTGDYHTEAVNANMGNVAATTGDAGTHAHYFDTLGVSEDHTHDTTVSISGTTGAGSGNTGNASPGTSSNGSGNTGNTTPTSGNSGSGSALNVMPKYYALCYIMKT